MNKDGIIKLRNSVAECQISLWGGNLLSYRPRKEKHDIFWLGDLNKFDNQQAIRGGIPVCWPRFAEEELNNHLPRHGFARLSMWNLQNVSVDDRQIEAELSLSPEAQYNLNLSARVLIKITDKLEYTLETTNNGDTPFNFSEALHAYFNVSSVDNIVIKGLAGHRYKNSLIQSYATQEEDLKIIGEVDRIFLEQTQPLEIIDKGYNRVIKIKKNGSDTTVVWNPNKDLVEMSPNQYKQFVCVEPSNVGESYITLQPHHTHKLTTTISVNRFDGFLKV